MSFHRFTRLGLSVPRHNDHASAARAAPKTPLKPHGTTLALEHRMSNVEIANTILEQLGGGRALFMMGVKDRPMAIASPEPSKAGA